MSSKPSYRPDIDGLRAVAVVGVVLYHYGATWLPGGFTGVDVFFVISGYLITSILRREIDAGEFSILGFYDRRIRRIVPALLVVLAATMAAGWLILMPGDYADLGASAAYAAAGLGNLYFYGNTGYFDQVSEMQPLLHTWSLGVEEQFYVVWPIALALGLAVVKNRRLFTAILSAAVLLAFAYAARKVGNDPKGAFYLPHPRAWELAVGALMAFVPLVRSQWLSQAMAALGAALIAWSLLRIRATDAFPGFNAAYACVGAALLIWPKAETVVSRTLSFRPAVWIGLISYSLYLWHWPVLVLYRHYINGDFPRPEVAALLATFSVALAFLSWRFVERPFRQPIAAPWRSVMTGIAAIAVTAVAGGALTWNAGFPARLPTEALEMRSLEVMWEWDCPEQITLEWTGRDYCNFGAPWETAKNKALLWGESHALHMAPVLNVDAAEHDISYLLYDGCIPAAGQTIREYFPGEPAHPANCASNWQGIVSYLGAHPEINVVVLSAYWSGRAQYLKPYGSSESTPTDRLKMLDEGLSDTIRAIDRPDRHIVILADIPHNPRGLRPLCSIPTASLPLRPNCGDRALGVPRDVFEDEQGPTNTVIAAVAARFERVSAVFPGQGLCTGERCLSVLNSQFLYYDADHFRRNLSDETYSGLAELTGIRSAMAEAVRWP